MPAPLAENLSVQLPDVRRHVGWRMFFLFAAIALFAGLAYQLHSGMAFAFDRPLLLQAHAFSARWLDKVVIAISWVGQKGAVVIDVLLVLVLLTRKYWREASFVAVSVLGTGLLNKVAKLQFARPRPALWPSITPEHSFSFPSGHAMGSMALVLVLILLAWGTRWRWPVVVLGAAFVCFVGAARIYLGVHYPSDILGGWSAAIAWVIAVYSVVFINRWQPWKRPIAMPRV